MALASWLFAALVAAATTPVQGYFLMGANNPLTIERIDPIVNDGDIAGHVHTVFGGSNFRLSTNTSYLRQSECSSVPIVEDKSNYWVPTMYFQWKNGSFSSVNGGAVIYYLFDDKAGVTTAFPDDFRMLSGDPLLRTYDASSYAQQAITFLCLDFNGVTTRHNELPRGKKCPSGIRAQVNFPMCWDGKNTDSPDHKSHVAFPSGGPDSGKCEDPKYPVTLPRVFMEMYWGTPDFKDLWNDTMDSEQPFVFSNGDPTGYGYHGDFFNGWDKGVLQKVVDTCSCDPNGSLDCCAQKGIFTLNKDRHCRITKAIDETTTGTLPKLPGNNPVQTAAEGGRASFVPDNTRPQLLSPIYVYYGDQPDKVGTPVAGSGGQTNGESGSGSNGQTTTTQATSATTPTQSPSQGSEGSSSTESSVPPASPTGTGSESGSTPTSPPVSSGSNNNSSSNGGSSSQGSDQQGSYPPTSTPVSSGSNNNGNNGGSTSQGSEQEGTNPPTNPPVSSGTNNNNGGNTSEQGSTNPPANPPVSSGSGSSNQHHGGGHGYEHGQGSGGNRGSGSGTGVHNGGKGHNSNSSHSNSGSGSSGGAKTCGRKSRKRSTTTSTKKRSAGFHRRRHSSGFEFNQF